MSNVIPFALDIVAVSVLTFGLYLPRHRRRDMVVSYLGVNIGVLAVAEAFTSTDVTAGLGLGLFGVLSIIRLRSSELDQHEVAYFFAALALGVLGGVPISPDWLAPALMASLLVGLFVGDHPRMIGALPIPAHQPRPCFRQRTRTRRPPRTPPRCEGAPGHREAARPRERHHRRRRPLRDVAQCRASDP